MKIRCCFLAVFLFVTLLVRSVSGQGSANSGAAHSARSDGGALTGTVRFSSDGKHDQNLVVYLEGVTGAYGASAQPAVLDQNHELFIPHLLPVQKGQTVKFTNSEPVSHNVHVFRGARSLLNITHFKGQDHDWLPPRPGEYEIRCNIHREMSAFIIVLEHPFFAAVSHQGSTSRFKIDGIPEGAYTMVAVRDQKGTLVRQEEKVAIKAKQTATVALTIPD